MSSNWKSRDVARITGLNTLQNILNSAKDEEKELRDVADEWQKSGGMLSFNQQIALIQRNSANRSYVRYFVYRLKHLNREIFSRYPNRNYLIKCILAAIDALHDSIAESSYIREQIKNKAIITALQSGAVVEGGEQYPFRKEDERKEGEDEEEYEIDAI